MTGDSVGRRPRRAALLFRPPLSDPSGAGGRELNRPRPAGPAEELRRSETRNTRAAVGSQCNSLSVSTGSPPLRLRVAELEKLIVEPSRAKNSLCVDAAGTSGSVTSNGWATAGGK